MRSVTDVQIDLGELRGAHDDPVVPPATRPPLPYRALAAALVLVLVALLAGAEHRGPPRPIVLPARLGDEVLPIGDQLFLIGSGRRENGEPVRDRVITRYRLPGVTLLDRTTVTVPGTIGQLVPAGDTLLVAYQLESTGVQGLLAMVAGTGRRLWQRNARLVGASPADHLVLLSDDHAHFAVDLDTGALRWRVPNPANGYLAEAGVDGQYIRWLVLVTDAGRLETLDAHTGRPLATTTLPALANRGSG